MIDVGWCVGFSRFVAVIFFFSFLIPHFSTVILPSLFSCAAGWLVGFALASALAVSLSCPCPHLCVCCLSVRRSFFFILCVRSLMLIITRCLFGMQKEMALQLLVSEYARSAMESKEIPGSYTSVQYARRPMESKEVLSLFLQPPGGSRSSDRSRGCRVSLLAWR